MTACGERETADSTPASDETIENSSGVDDQGGDSTDEIVPADEAEDSTDEVGATNDTKERGTTNETDKVERDDESEETGTENGDAPSKEFTPQSESLRQQQYVVSVGGALLAGFALALSSVQHFPDLPTVAPVLAGLLGGGLVYWVTRRSLFPTAEELSGEQ